MVHEPKRYFSNMMKSPYFQTKHYEEEHTQMEKKIENITISVINKILFWRKKNVL